MTTLSLHNILARSSRLTTLATPRLGAFLLAASCTLACGGGSGRGLAGNEGGTGGEASFDDSAPVDVAAEPGGEAGGTAVSCDDRPVEMIELNQTIWQTGFKASLGSAAYVAATPSCSLGSLTIDATLENRVSATEAFPALVLLRSEGRDYEVNASNSELPLVPGSRKGNGIFSFALDRQFVLDEAFLTFGAPNRHQAQVPLLPSAEAPLVTLEPQALPLSGQMQAGTLAFDFQGAFVAADAYWEHESLAVDEVALRLDFSATYSGNGFGGGVLLGDEDLSLELPDGTSIVAVNYINELFDGPGATSPELWVRFIIPAPVAGRYKLVANGVWAGKNQTEVAEAEFPFELPAMPTFGDK
ncbi:MAG TPA: hypothetical protein VJN18_02915 [Polyangiaceae bacterium]|nr:hypothetical protein [Polyangiaceae bacterium]